MSATLEGFFDAKNKYLIHSVPALPTYNFLENLKSNRTYSESLNSVCDFIERRLTAHIKSRRECFIYLHWWTDSWPARYKAMLDLKDYVERMYRREKSRDPNVTINFDHLSHDGRWIAAGWFTAQIIIK